MLFILILASFSLIGLIAFKGDYKEKEIEEDKKHYEQITGSKYL